MIKLATQKGGQCLSETYENCNKKINWECKLGHKWEAKPYHVVAGSWCPRCAQISLGKKNRKYSIQDMQNIATKREGKCLSSAFVSVMSKLEWQCRDGHKWDAIPSSIMRGSWCPHCRYLGETKCRYVFERIFESKFPKTKIDNATLELDGYCRKLQIAFEYQGQQHYRYIPYFHRTAESFSKSQLRDKQKFKWCRANNINLVIVPYWENKTDNQLSQFIQNQTGLFTDVDWSDFYQFSSQLEKFRKIAIERGGKLISEKYEGVMSKLEWECKEGHRWEAIPDSVIGKGRWCPYCARNVKLSIEKMNEIAELKGGKCL